MTGHKHAIIHYPLSAKFQIVMSSEPVLELPIAMEEEIELIWLKEKARRHLYNASLFSLISYDENRIVGRFVQYRYYIASRQSKKIQGLLKIHPVGISALSICNKSLLVGTRDLKLATYGGYLECVPSGSIESRAYMQGEVDYMAQAMWELQEEARIGEKEVNEVHPLGLFYSPYDGVYDIGLVIRLKEVEIEQEPEGTQEYPLLKWYSFKEWEQKLQQPDAKIVPLSKSLWTTFHKK